jgi:ankyrin repeat protein
LPETLDETYERVLRDINKTNRGHAHRLLQCLTVAIRPLHVEELAEVLAVDFDATSRDGIPKLNSDWRWEDQQQAVLSTCSSLISIVDEGRSRVVQFSHFSVKEFLTSKRLASSSGDISQYHIDLGTAHTILAQACLSVLIRLDDQVNKDNVRSIPLGLYAAQHWVRHAQFENVSSSIRNAIEYFFCADIPRSAWLWVYDVFYHGSPFYFSIEIGGRPLYCAALCGLYDMVEYFIAKHPRDINPEGGEKAIPLVAALHGNYFEVAELLLRHGADINVPDDNGWTQLHLASILGPIDRTEWLLGYGADANAKDQWLWTPLHRAVLSDNFKIACLLIEHKADINARDDNETAALHLASQCYTAHSRLNFMRLFLEHGADANVRDSAGSTSLHILAPRQRDPPPVQEVCLLLKYGANIDAENNEGKTALQIAFEEGNHKMVELLIEHGAKRMQDSASPDASYWCGTYFHSSLVD